MQSKTCGKVVGVAFSPAARPRVGHIRQAHRDVRVAGMSENMERSLFGENFGARDPTAGEIESNFTDKVLGNFDTEHIIKPPDKMGNLIGLKSRQCVPCEGEGAVLDETQIELLRNQVPGWKVVNSAEGVPKIRTEWKLKDHESGLELVKRITAIAEEQGHHPDLHLEDDNSASAELSTHTLGGLTENDFIMAAKINAVDFSDLIKKAKPKFWA